MESRIVHADDGTPLHVGVTGSGPDVVVLSGGPGCVHYLERDEIAPRGMRAWYPEPRGVGRSGGGPHDIEAAVADLESVRRAAGAERWVVLGHSWGADLAVRYALGHPGRVRAVVAVAAHGLHKDRTWSQVYESLKDTEPPVPIEWDREVHRSLGESFVEWIHEPGLYRSVADCPVPIAVIAAEGDIRPSWPLRQLAALAPRGSYAEVPGVPHDFWATHPEVWTAVVSDACSAALHS
ncbi:alpha/beta fold hydrolase [Glycomyces albidus]|uniref:Alpha/beta fold hydrolase n=1 Tax=Glycomyces albidus TaxID=2656774 RepID=A0A6L5G7L2_9ACTN|nr:alpha/beta hydrolase [Glycomyces albidus]MQM25626.1 alpha/beta fold hydrolase [Glycomyces albidus]